MNKKTVSAFFLIFLNFCLFAEINLLSPIAGIWANRQLLVIDTSSDGDYFYSINGSDPEKFGFAYDGPVLLDTNGEITLKITFVAHNGRKESKTVNFNVIENPALAQPYEYFVSTFYDTGILSYSSGSVLTIPSQLHFSFGLPPDSFIPGQDISISDKSILNRMIPCVVWDKTENLKWRFVVQTFPQTAGIYSRRDVPFSIENWETITFTDSNLIYKIDSEFWELPKKPRKLDRSVSHMISWQSINFEAGNPIEFFVLPPKPELCSRYEEDGAVTYYIDGDNSYTMSVISYGETGYQELFTELGADTFYGDKVKGELTIGIFSNSVYQGEIFTNYEIDKRPPVSPEIISSSQYFYCREDVSGSVIGEEGSMLYVAVSDPFILPESGVVYSETDSLFKTVSAQNYKNVTGSKYDFKLSAEGEGAVYYKICAYSKSGENISQVTEYQVIIDQYNYYFDSSAQNEIADGTIQNPFTNFTQCVASLNKSRSACLKIKGEMKIPSGKHELLSNCVMQNDGNASIVFEGDSSLVIKNASVEMKDFRITGKKGKNSSIIPLFKLENSVLSLNNCESGIEFYKNGTFIDSFNSIINVTDSIISVSAITYTSFVSAVKTRINIRNSTVNTSGDTTVIISSNQGHLNLLNNSFKVTAKSGRIAELFATEALFEKNNFTAQLSKKQKITAIYADKASEVTESKNISYGF